MSSMSTPLSLKLGYVSQKKIYKKADNKKEHGFDRWATTRVSALINIPKSILASVADTVVGAAFSVFSIITLGQVKKLNRSAHEHLLHAGRVTTSVYVYTLQTLNPQAKIKDFKQVNSSGPKGGVLHGISTRKLDQLHRRLVGAGGVKKHILSRLVSLVKIPTAIVARIADFAIGIFAALASIVTLGLIEKVNTFAYHQLPVLNLASDIYESVITLFNPDGLYESFTV